MRLNAEPLVVAAAGCAAAGCAGYGVLVEQFRLQVSCLDLAFPHLPSAFDGYTILHLSDLHLTKFGKLESRLATLLSQREVDLCLITGDITQTPKARWAFERLCNAIRRRERTIYAVLGNSEHKPWTDTKTLIEALSEQGVNFLINTSQAIYHDDQFITIVGVDDPYSRKDNLDLAFKNVDPKNFIIFLTHCPSTTLEAISHGADLILAGHTHGGQVRLPGLGVLWTHMRSNKKLNDGLYTPERLTNLLGCDCGSSVLFVNRGVGTSKLHIRFLCPPEIAYITLRRTAGQTQTPQGI